MMPIRASSRLRLLHPAAQDGQDRRADDHTERVGGDQVAGLDLGDAEGTADVGQQTHRGELGGADGEAAEGHRDDGDGGVLGRWRPATGAAVTRAVRPAAGRSAAGGQRVRWRQGGVCAASQIWRLDSGSGVSMIHWQRPRRDDHSCTSIEGPSPGGGCRRGVILVAGRRRRTALRVAAPPPSSAPSRRRPPRRPPARRPTTGPGPGRRCPSPAAAHSSSPIDASTSAISSTPTTRAARPAATTAPESPAARTPGHDRPDHVHLGVDAGLGAAGCRCAPRPSRARRRGPIHRAAGDRRPAGGRHSFEHQRRRRPSSPRRR